MQKVLLTANKLPQPHTFPEFKKRGGAEFAGALKNSECIVSGYILNSTFYFTATKNMKLI